MGPLPRLYRFLVAGVVTVLGLAGGIWLARWMELPLGGIGVGLVAGGALAFLATRDVTPAAHRSTHGPRRR